MKTGIRRSLRTALAGSLLFGGLTTASLAAITALTPGTASASPMTTLFSSTTAGTYSVTVPPGVTSVTITAVGGTGGSVPLGCIYQGFYCFLYYGGGTGGAGAVVTATVAVVPSSVLTVTVAQNAGTGAGSGGDAGSGPLTNGASGGGASAVYEGLSPLVVAAGGGGAGASLNTPANGGAAGQAGQPNSGCTAGGAGSQTTGGSAGTCAAAGGVPFDVTAATPGGLGNGGNGGSAGFGDAVVGGGGGGGGYYGGGGSSFGGAGGGSSYPEADVTGLDTTATPSVTITYVPPCGAGLTPHVLNATYATRTFTGLFCVNAKGIGTYTQGTVSGIGAVTTVKGTTLIGALGKNLLLAGRTNGTKSGFVEVAPVRAIGTFTLS